MKIRDVEISTYRIPTDHCESDGTLAWTQTDLVVVTLKAGSKNAQNTRNNKSDAIEGIGYSYTQAHAAAAVIRDVLAQEVIGQDIMNIETSWQLMLRAVRNIGRPGLASCALSAVDAALWDLKAKYLKLPLVHLLGSAHENMPIYGSGGFTSESPEEMQIQLNHWAEQGISMVKLKVGTDPDTDLDRVAKAREAIGPSTDLFVDANGGYERKQALQKAEEFSRLGVSWFEEPVSSDDLSGLKLLRDRAPSKMKITAGEYGYDLFYFQRMIDAEAVDVLQVDATRCGGITGLLKAGVLCEAYSLPLSAHTAPALHLHACCAIQNCIHIEYFYDHVRIERMFFDGFPEPVQGRLTPDQTRPGFGLSLKTSDIRKFKIS